MGIQSHQIININRWTKGQGEKTVKIAPILSTADEKIVSAA